MGTNMNETKSEVLKVRITPTIRQACRNLRASGAWSGRAESDFLGYLIELGMKRYERSILPIERGGDLNSVIKSNREEENKKISGE